MTREGYNLSLKELELERIANISTYIYVLASTLARASRYLNRFLLYVNPTKLPLMQVLFNRAPS